MAQIDTFTGQTPADTYTKIVQITEDNEVLDAVGAQISPIFKAGATVTGSVNVDGTIYQNGQPVGAGAFNVNAQNELYVDKNVGIGTDNPEAKLEVELDSTETEDFFIIRKKNIIGEGHTMKEIFSVNNDGVMTLGGNETPPSVTQGGMYYNSTEDEFYLGFNE